MTGESPIVDVQSATKQRVHQQGRAALDIPTGRTQFTAATLIPGMNLNNQDVGGTNIINTTGGSDDDPRQQRQRPARDDRRAVDRQHRARRAGQQLPARTWAASRRWRSITRPARPTRPPAACASTSFRGKAATCSKASLFATGVNSSFQGSNYTHGAAGPRAAHAELASRCNYDINPGFGGPLRKRHALVLRVGAVDQDAELRRRHVRQHERGTSRTSGPTSPDLNQRAFDQRVPAQRQPPPDVAGQPEEQVQLLRRRPGPLPVRERDRDDRRRKRRSRSSIRSSGW